MANVRVVVIGTLKLEKCYASKGTKRYFVTIFMYVGRRCLEGEMWKAPVFSYLA
jgi:hypothetical protein